jgi:hypothetical protein
MGAMTRRFFKVSGPSEAGAKREAVVTVVLL